jgi:hypothetical protein
LDDPSACSDDLTGFVDAFSGQRCATDGMENDWQKLGDVVARIAQRLEVTSGPPIARADADLLVRLLSGEIPAPELGAVPCGQEPQRKDSQ